MPKMNIAQWNPVEEFLPLRDAVSQLLGESFVHPPMGGRREEGFAPAIDVSETTNAFIVEAAVPGLKADDLNVSVENNVLTISGEIRQEAESGERNYHRIERRYGKFQRVLTLPNTVKVDAINASMTNGVLRLEIPKADEVKPRRININVNN
jgi:HSP20 family protein